MQVGTFLSVSVTNQSEQTLRIRSILTHSLLFFHFTESGTILQTDFSNAEKVETFEIEILVICYFF